MLRFKNQFYGVTCAHVITGFNVGDLIQLNHHNPDIGILQTKLIENTAPPNLNPLNWNAKQDIAILQILTPLPEAQITMELQTPHTYSERDDCWCFGFQWVRGVMIKEISTKYKVAGGFIQIDQLGERKIAQGTSGAPLFDRQFGIIGMVQAVKRQTDVAYLIPSSEILNVLNQWTNKKE